MVSTYVHCKLIVDDTALRFSQFISPAGPLGISLADLGVKEGAKGEDFLATQPCYPAEIQVFVIVRAIFCTFLHP